MKFLEYLPTLPTVRTNILLVLATGLVGSLRRAGGSTVDFGLGFLEGIGAGIAIQAIVNVGTRWYNRFNGVPERPQPLSAAEMNLQLVTVGFAATAAAYMMAKGDNGTRPDPTDPQKMIPAPHYSCLDYLYRTSAGAGAAFVFQGVCAASERAGEIRRGENPARPKGY